MLDMSKAFDTVNRKKLTEDLKSVLERDELHMMDILIKDVTMKVKVNDQLGEEFTTTVGIAQGDCLSAVLFIYYLARTLNKEHQEHDHTYAKTETPSIPEELEDHEYFIKKQDYFEVAPKYADDITWVSTAKHRIN